MPALVWRSHSPQHWPEHVIANWSLAREQTECTRAANIKTESFFGRLKDVSFLDVATATAKRSDEHLQLHTWDKNDPVRLAFFREHGVHPLDCTHFHLGSSTYRFWSASLLAILRELHGTGARDGSKARDSLGTLALRDESYATVVVGNGFAACAATVLGEALRELDSSRRLTAIVFRTSNATRAILRRGGWMLYEAPRDAVFRSRCLRPERCRRGNGWLRHPSPTLLKLLLWGLPYRAVIYFDTDHIPVITPFRIEEQRRRLRALWHGDEPLLAVPERPGCFCSAMMRVLPSREANQLHMDAMVNPPATDAMRRCSISWYTDQPLLNALHPLWAPLAHGDKSWNSENFFNFVEHGRCHLRSVDEVARQQIDSYHFFSGNMNANTSRTRAGQCAAHQVLVDYVHRRMERILSADPALMQLCRDRRP